MRNLLLVVAIGVLLAGVGMAAPVALVEAGKSGHVIYLAAEAPGTVKQAAADLQEYLERATGAKLAIVSEPREPMICLGDNPALRAAGLSPDGLALEAFRVVTRGTNVFIFGPDTADGAYTPQGGTSAGTRNGVAGFLERFVGVRWLMPGAHGDYVPRTASLSLPDTDWTEAPFFLNRRVPYTQENTATTKQWWARQKLGWSLYLHHSHNWHLFSAAELQAHPEWLPLHGGARTPQVSEYSKLCPSDPGLVQAFADKAIAAFDADPNRKSFSLSPSDGGAWCECERCRAGYEKDPNGELSVTPTILEFYNRVARIVGQKHPDRTLAGYVYAAYVYPPSKPFKLEPNLFLVWAPSFDYGFTLFRPDMQQRWDALVPQWLKATSNISYYDLPNCLHNRMGAINPPGLKILKFLYPRLKQAGMKGVYVYGNPAWGYAGPMNYLLAKLAWNPDADVDALFNEYCEKAYGEGAAEIKQFYHLLDAATEAFFLAHADASYSMTPARLKDVYAASFPELERLYRAAEAKTAEPETKYRLGMLGTNLQVLHWYLRQYGYLENATASSFYLADDKLVATLKDPANALALAPEPTAQKPAAVGQKLAVAALEPVPGAQAVEAFTLRGDQQMVLRPEGGPVEIKFSSVSGRGTLIWCHVFDAEGKPVTSSLVSPAVPLRLEQPASAFYHLSFVAGSASFRMEVKGARWAAYTRGSGAGLHLLTNVTPLYFEVPAGVASFSAWVSATPPGETVAATLYSPTGREAAKFDCSAKSLDQQQVKVEAGEAGVWKLVLGPAAVGIVDDVWVKLGEELPGYASFVPAQALSVRAAPQR